MFTLWNKEKLNILEKIKIFVFIFADLFLRQWDSRFRVI